MNDIFIFYSHLGGECWNPYIWFMFIELRYIDKKMLKEALINSEEAI